MSHPQAAPETDLLLTLPGPGEQWDAHTVHTHYFGFDIAEAGIGAFIYVRYQPAFPLCQGGVCIFRGTDNLDLMDLEWSDYELTMPWPQVDGNVIETENGLRIEFLELGHKVRLTYASHDGQTSFDLLQEAVTPLLARGHIIPGEDTNSDPARSPGGTEQIMHCTGELVLRGERHAVDCHAARDRSFNQVRTESRAKALKVPPVGWSPMYFGEHLIFNQVSFQDPSTDPLWAELYTLPEGRPTHHFAWVIADGEMPAITRVVRNVLEHHPVTHAAMRQEITAQDEHGREYRFTGEAIAMARLLAWPNAAIRVGVYRWTDELGRTTTNTYQEMWFDDVFQRFMNERARALA